MWRSCRRPPAVSIDKGQRKLDCAMRAASGVAVWLCGSAGMPGMRSEDRKAVFLQFRDSSLTSGT